MEKSERIAQLIIRFQKGDISAFDEIYNETCQKTFSIAQSICKNKEDAQDVVQEVYMHFYKKADEIKKPESFGSWLGTVTANRAKNQLRKKNPLLFKDSETEALVINSIEDEDNGARPEADFMNEELQAEVMEMVESLGEEKKTVVLLYYYENMKTKEIAEALEINENTVKSRLLQARKDLSKKVEALKKDNKSLYSIAPIWLIIFALRDSTDAAGKAFADSKASAAVLENIHTSISAASASSVGTATKTAVSAAKNSGKIAAKIAGATVIQKIVAGVIAVSIVAGSVAGAVRLIGKSQKENENYKTVSQTNVQAEINSEDNYEQVYPIEEICNTLPFTFNDIQIKLLPNGRCGEKIFYSFDSDSGTLIVSGSGELGEWENTEQSIHCQAQFCDERIKKLIISDGITGIGYEAFMNCKNLKTVILGKDVQYIQEHAFACSGIENIVFPDSLTEIGEGAFEYCTKLKTIQLPNKLQCIKEGAFNCCINLVKVSVSNSLSTYTPQNKTSSTIEVAAFAYCNKLTEVKLPYNITKIEYTIFYGDTSLKSIYFGTNITHIPERVFVGCENLQDIYYKGTKEEWEAITINDLKDTNRHVLKANIHFNSTY